LVLGTFPNITGKNASGPTATDGTPFTADYINDMWGAMQDILNAAGLTPNGQAEAAGSSQILTALQRGAGLPPGTILMAAWNPVTQALMRTIPMNGQLIPIGAGSPYLGLVGATYVGDSHNGDANLEGYYKCDAGGNRNTAGAYFRIPDQRGLFVRAAGQNGTKKMANDTPYDGMSIGSYIADAMQNITGDVFTVLAQGDPLFIFSEANGCFYSMDGAKINQIGISGLLPSDTLKYASLRINAALVARTSTENRPASISAYVCIKY
jgi:hypothetical protein